MAKANRFPPELRDQAVQTVLERRADHNSEWAAIVAVAGEIGCTPQTLRTWIRRTEVDDQSAAPALDEASQSVKGGGRTSQKRPASPPPKRPARSSTKRPAPSSAKGRARPSAVAEAAPSVALANGHVDTPGTVPEPVPVHSSRPDAIEAVALEKTFGRSVRALDKVSFTVPAGSVFGLLGPNGAGKTTAVRVLSTILSPDAGSARVLGYDVVRQASQVRANIGLAGQYAAVDGNLTGRENLQMVGRLNHMSRSDSTSRARELLALFHLTDAGDRPLKTYSGGMRRRLDLAAALVARPPVLFLDEPTNGLDPHSRVDLWEMVEQLVAAGTTVLLTTQYLEEADRLADRVAVVDAGRIIAEGTPAELKASMGATVLDVQMPDTDSAAEVAAILGGIGANQPILAGNAVELPVDDGARSAMEALLRLEQRGIIPVRFALREPSLDDVFRAITNRETGSTHHETRAGEQPDATPTTTGDRR